ncbi:MAG: C40 family peptidase [Epsilonproteobacteria bacterium]|nr:C40 family peptidase [Campylobacterota bacterium]
MKKTALFLLTLTLLFSACSSTPKPKKKQTIYKLHKKNFVTTALYHEYEKWAGVQYCYGGDNANGIDCSALVQMIYKEAFNIELPTTTKKQLQVGKSIPKSKLKKGDILFFRTSYRVLHSGIYLERGNFIHTSSKQGVILSNIHNPYWRAKYYTARRVLY